MTIYLRYEYFEKGCFELTCLVSDVEISSTKLVKPEIVVTIILIIGQFVHFFGILVLLYQHKWFALQGDLKQARVNYFQDHQRLMISGFGKGYDFEMNRINLDKGKYLTVKLEELEERLDKEYERFDELHRYLGHQYCHNLEPSVIGYKRCVAHLLLEQIRTYLLVAIIILFSDKIWQLFSIFLVQNVYFILQLSCVRASP